MRTAILTLSLLAVGYICYIFGREISFADQWPLYEALRTTASIIFGVMGAWIAIVYPEVLTKIFDKKTENKKDEIRKIKRLLLPLGISTLILAAILVIGIASPILKQIDFFTARIDIARGISFSSLGILTLVQLWTLIASLAPGEHLLFELYKEESKSSLVKRLQSNIKK
ncbi:MAG: hypothetical protein ABW150_01635 [Candidatus Thiodiazotropha sp.]